MSKCPNKNHPDWKALVAKHKGNEDIAYFYWFKDNSEGTSPNQIKSGVLEVFENNSKLSSIGTKEQYSQYLDTIFPDSKVKDIVYHGTEDKFDKFDIKFFGKNDYGDLGKGFYFAFDKANIFNEPIVISAVINDIEAKISPGYEIMIPKSEQIHILGSKEDIAGFKKFVSKGTSPTESTTFGTTSEPNSNTTSNYNSDTSSGTGGMIDDSPWTATAQTVSIEEPVEDDSHILKLAKKTLNNLEQRKLNLAAVAGGNNIEEIKARMISLTKSIEKLKKNIGYENITKLILKELEEAQRILNMKNSKLFDLNEVRDIVEKYENIDSEEFFPLEQHELAHKIRENLKEIKRQFNIKLLAAVLNVAVKNNVTLSTADIQKLRTDISGITAHFYDLGRLEHPIARLVYKIINDMKISSHQETWQFHQDIKDFAQANYKRDEIKKSDFDPITENGHFIFEYSQDYLEGAKELYDDLAGAQETMNAIVDKKGQAYARAKKAKSLIYKKQFAFYKKNHNYYLTPEAVAVYKSHLADVEKRNKNSFGAWLSGGKEIYEKWIAEHSPYLTGSIKDDVDPSLGLPTGTKRVDLSGSNNVFSDIDKVWNKNWYKYLYRTSNENSKNPRFDGIKDHPLYKFIIQKYVEAGRMLPHEVALDIGNYHKFINSLVTDLTSREASMGNILSNAVEGFKDLYTIKATLDDIEGARILTIKDPSTGEERKERVPILRQTDHKGRTIPYVRPRSLKSIVEANKTANPIDILKSYYNVAVLNKHRLAVKPELDLLVHFVDRSPARSNNSLGISNKDSDGTEQFVEEGLNNLAEVIRYNVGVALTGEASTDRKGGSSVEREISEDKRRKLQTQESVRLVSGVKIADTITNFTRISLIGFKPFTAMANLVMGWSSNYIYAARGKEFTEDNLDKASTKLLGSVFRFWTHRQSSKLGMDSEALKIANILERFRVTHSLHETQELTPESKAMNKIVRLFFSMQEGGEFLISAQIVLAMMDKIKVTDKSGNETTLYDAFDKNGQIKDTYDLPEWNTYELLEEGINKSKLEEFVTTVSEVRKRTQGNYQDPLMFKGKWYFRMLGLFRTWIPEYLRERYGAKSEDGKFEGRYRTFWNYLVKAKKSGGALGVGKYLGATLLGGVAKVTNINVLPFVGNLRFKGIDNAAKEMLETYLKGQKASDLEIENMRANIAELNFILLATGLGLSLVSLKGDGDDDDDYTINFLLNLMTRWEQELTASIAPGSFFNIIKDPIPTSNIIKNAQDISSAGMDFIMHPTSEENYYQRGKHKDELKLWKEIQDLLPVYSAINSTTNIMNTVFNSDAYKYTKK